MKLSMPLLATIMLGAIAAGCDKKINVVVTNANDIDVNVGLSGPGEITPYEQIVPANGGQRTFHIKAKKNELPATYVCRYGHSQQSFVLDSKTKNPIAIIITLSEKVIIGDKKTEYHGQKSSEGTRVVEQDTVPTPDK